MAPQKYPPDQIAAEILEEILFLELPAGAQPVGERALREALCRWVDWRKQRRAWEGLKAAFDAAPGAARR